MNVNRDLDSKSNMLIILSIVGVVLLAIFMLRLTKKYSFKNKVEEALVLEQNLLSFQNCVITGGSSGLGKAVASQLLKKGANVFLIARNQAQLDETVDTLLKDKIDSKQKIGAISADVTNFQSIKDAIKKLESKHKQIDVLFSCAGIIYM